MTQRQFEIAVIGGANGDIILDTESYRPEFREDGILFRHGEEENFVPTDKTPSKNQDKVSSYKDLDDLATSAGYFFKWGGGALNSVTALSNLRGLDLPMGLTYVTTSRPDLFVGGEHHDLIAYLEGRSINQLCMNSHHLNYSLVLGGDNKMIVRNKRKGSSDFKLSREHKGTLDAYLNPADGVLINSLKHADMMNAVVQSIHEENERFYQFHRTGKSLEELAHSPAKMGQPRHRKALTVLTKSTPMSRHEMTHDVIPFTGVIMNYEDALSIFYGREEADVGALGLDPALRLMAQMRYGMPTREGLSRRIEDPHNNVYVTLGKQGHLVAVGDKAYHVGLKQSTVEDVNHHIRKNRSSTNGAGDSFAAGVAYQETIGQASDVEGTAAKANEVTLKFLGVNRVVHREDVEVRGEWDLKDLYQDSRLEL